jgi:hypothetical protein
MKVLSVSSGNSEFGISPIVKNQGESLRKNGIDLDYFTIKGKSINGYLKNILILKKYLKAHHYGIINSHYSFCGWVSKLTLTKILVIVSYMGSDTYGNVNIDGERKFYSYINILSAKLLHPFVNKIIVKSKNLESYTYFKNIYR